MYQSYSIVAKSMGATRSPETIAIWGMGGLEQF